MSEKQDLLKSIRKAIKEVKREALKAAIIHGTIESSLILVLLIIGLSFSNPSWIPGWSFDVGGYIGFISNDIVLDGKKIIAIGVSLLFFIFDVAIVYKRRTIETFETINPEVREALRTARDISRDGEDHVMARNLYEDVLERLKSTSSEGFISLKRIGFLIGIIAIIGILIGSAAFLSTQFSIGGGLFPGGGGGGDGDGRSQTSGTSEDIQYQGLQNPDSVLGESENVGSGSDELDLGLTDSGGGTGEGDSGYGSGELSGDTNTNVEAQRSGYSSEEQIEDSELVKEYNLRIRE